MDIFVIGKYCMLFSIVLANYNSPVVKIQQGVLSGRYLRSQKGRTFSAFTGIPYTEPPIGELRFKAPQPAKPWKGVLNATNVHAVCPQSSIIFGDPTVTGDENCLHLNVYTPQLPIGGKKLLPVMIFFHGGGFILGNGNYDSSILMDKDIVLVIPNYRLGPLGFLSTGDKVVPGNNGLKDQNLAILWIKKNIAHFGGNPDRITVFGQSAGGTSAHYHMLSPLSRDLIKGVISESGTAISLWGLAPNDQRKRNAKKLANYFDCPTETSYKMVECLRKVDAYELIRKQDLFLEWNLDPMTPFKPVIEPNIKGAFLPEHPAEIIRSGKAAKVPFITGITTEDGAMKSPELFGKPHLLDEFNKEFIRIAPLTLGYDETAPDKDCVSKKIREFYFKGGEINNSSKSAVTNMYTDGLFLLPLNEVVRLHAKYTKQPVFYYAFGYRSSISYSMIFGDPTDNYAVCHADELLHVFPPGLTFPDYKPSNKDKNISEILTTLWTNFAATGDPNSASSPLLTTKWEAVKSDNLEYYIIKNDTSVEMADKLYWERAEFWRHLPIDPIN